jgi:hypothetical protein
MGFHSSPVTRKRDCPRQSPGREPQHGCSGHEYRAKYRLWGHETAPTDGQGTARERPPRPLPRAVRLRLHVQIRLPKDLCGHAQRLVRISLGALTALHES